MTAAGTMAGFHDWEDTAQYEPEVLLMIKTVNAHFEAVRGIAMRRHPCEGPEVTRLDITDVLPGDMTWVFREIRVRE